MFWAGIVDDKLVGPFTVLEGVKMNSENYISFLLTTLSNDTIQLTLRLVFMQDVAPSNVSKKKG